MRRLNEILRSALLLAGVLFLSILTIQVWRLPKIVGGALQQRLDVLAAGVKARDTQLAKILEDVQVTTHLVQQTAESTYWDTQASSETTAALLKRTYDLVDNTDRNLNGGKDVKGLLPAAQGLIEVSGSLVGSLQQDTHSLLGDAGPTQDSLRNLAGLLTTLDHQVDGNGEVTQQTLRDLDKAIQDLDKLFENPNITGTLQNIDKTTGHLAGSAESVDIALRPLREKAHLVKVVLLKAVGLFRIVVPLPF